MVKRVAIIAALLAGAVIGASDPDAAVRSEFKQAYAAVGNQTVMPDSAALRAYVLYPYLQAARLKRELTMPQRDLVQVDQAIGAWLQAQGNVPATFELRHTWLLDLAARQQWRDIAALAPLNSGDVELRCIMLTAQLRSEVAPLPEVIGPVISALWLNAQRLPSACNAPFDWARAKQVLGPTLVEQRARLALQADNVLLARELLAELPRKQAEPLRQWAQLIEDPAGAIVALIKQPGNGVEPAALQDGWARLARKDPQQAMLLLPRLLKARALNQTAASSYVLSVALALAWSRRPEALDYFRRVVPAAMSEQGLEWQARAALWAGDWQVVQQTILAMPEALRQQARWRYWLARAKQQREQPAAQLYQQLIANDDNYYAAMAAARLGSVYTPHAQPLADEAQVNTLLMQHVGLQRAHEWWLLAAPEAALSEWSAVFARLQPGEHVTAARLAHSWGWYDLAITITAKLGLYNDYAFLYPRPYAMEVSHAVQRSALPAELLYAVMRQETLFRATAKSNAGALGLLQLLPDTARQTARKAALPAPSAEQLFDPNINLSLGALYLQSLLQDFAGEVELALAAYNAGPAAARRWLPSRALDADIWIENIPYNETRNYVQRVLWHSLVFRWLLQQQPLDTQAWLKQVP